MQITQATIINIVSLLAVLALGWYIKRNFAAVMAQVKEHLFTCHGFVIALLWALLTTGVFCSAMFIRVSSGSDVAVQYPTEEDMAGLLGKVVPRKGK